MPSNMEVGCRFLARAAASSLLTSLFLIAGCSKNEPPQQEKPKPSPTATPTPVLPRKIYDTARFFNGITVKSSVEATPSSQSALHLERDADSYTLHLELRLQVPSPATNSEALLAATPELGPLLPDLDGLLGAAAVSADYSKLFANKEKNLRANLVSLQRLLPLDTLYDCQTILNLRNPKNDRHALLVQALMNVNTDGSDGDRNLSIDTNSAFFQPQTNYRWPKASSHPNPCLKETVLRLEGINKKLASLPEESSPSVQAEKMRLLAAKDDTKATLEEIRHWSFLVGAADPFIVLPSFMFTGEEGHPEIGDYAVVIADGTLYPAILGDKGPNYKIGEASLRLCREIDDKSTAEARPVDHPTVSYLIFPGTAEKPFASPDYKHWSERCHALWKEFGGSDAAIWQEWESLEKPWPTPTPTPTPLPTPDSSPSPVLSAASILTSDSLLPPSTVPESSPSPTSASPSPSPTPLPSSNPPVSGTNPASSATPLLPSGTTTVSTNTSQIFP